MIVSSMMALPAVFAVISLFLGERPFRHLDGLRTVLSGLGVLAVLSTTALRAWAFASSRGPRRRVERTFLLSHAGVLLALFMSNAGGAWDNAKKTIEQGKHGGKGSDAHKAAVVGDTVGDPFKDTSGPSLNILVKLMTVVGLVFLPWFISS